MQYLLVILVFFLPTVVLPFLKDAFSLPKVTFFRLIMLMLSASFMARVVRQPARTNPRAVKSPLNLPVASFLAASVLASVFSIDPSLSFYGMYRFYFNGLASVLSYAALYFIVITAAEMKSVNGIVRAVLAGSVAVIIYALMQSAGLDFVAWTASPRERVWSTLGNPDFLGAYLIMVIPLAAAVFLAAGSYAGKVSLFMLFLFLSGTLVLTKSRASWLGFFVSMGMFSALLREEIFKKHGKWALSFLGIVAASVLILAAIKPVFLAVVASRLFSITDMKEANIVSRLSGYGTAIEAIKKSPLLGTGLDTFSITFRRHMSASYARSGGVLLHPGYAHNEFLQILLDMGIIGLSIYLWLLSVFFVTCAKVMKRKDDAKILCCGIMCSVIALLVQNQFSFSVLATSVLFWLMLGLAVVLENRNAFPQSIPVPVKRGTGKIIYPAMTLLVTLISLVILKPLLAEFHFTRAESGINPVSGYEKAVRLNPVPGIYRINLGKAYRKCGNSGKAIAEFKKEIEINPFNALGYNALGTVYVEESKREGDAAMLDEGIAALEKAIELDPNFTEPHVTLGTAYERKGEIGKAVDVYRRSLAIDPALSVSHFNLGCIYGNRKMFEEAFFHFRKALAIDPGYEKAKEYIAVIKNRQ